MSQLSVFTVSLLYCLQVRYISTQLDFIIFVLIIAIAWIFVALYSQTDYVLPSSSYTNIFSGSQLIYINHFTSYQALSLWSLSRTRLTCFYLLLLCWVFCQWELKQLVGLCVAMQWCPVSLPQEKLVSAVPLEDLTVDLLAKSRRVVSEFLTLAQLQELVLVVNELSGCHTYTRLMLLLDPSPDKYFPSS